MTKIALILQGGGALGAFEFGVVAKLVEMGFEPTAVAGVSIGAINAAAIAGARGGDIIDSLGAVWDAITLPQLPLIPPSQQANLSLLGNPNFWLSRTDYLNMFHWNSLCTTAPMLQTLATHLDFDQLNRPEHIRLAVTATDLHNGGLTTFSNYLADEAHTRAGKHQATRTVLTPAHVVASGSLPPGFPATGIEGRQYWDGGLFSNTPIDALLNLLNPDEIANLPIYVVDLFPTDDQPAPANLVEVTTRASALQYENRFWAEYGGDAGLSGFVDMLDQLDGMAKGTDMANNTAFAWLMRLRAMKNLHVIASAPAVNGGDHDFSKYGVQDRFAAGQEAVIKHFEQPDRLPAALREAA